MEPNTLLLNVGCARGLYMKNHNMLDAYAVITLQGKGSMKSRATTEVIHTEGECKWDETCEFKLTEKSTHISVVVNHKTKMGTNDLIGKCEVTLAQAKTLGTAIWYPLKKKKDDEKYRGEIQLQFTFNYQRDGLSISSLSLNQIGDGEKKNFMSKIKKKIHLGKHKKAEDTMSIASGVSAFSMASKVSTKSGSKFMNRLNRTLGGLHIGKDKDKSATLSNGYATDHGARRNSYLDVSDYDVDRHRHGSIGNSLNASSNSLAQLHGHGASYDDEMPYGSGGSANNSIDNHHPRSPTMNGGSRWNTIGHGVGGSVGGGAASLNGHTSPTVSTAESFHLQRDDSIRSGASSGFASAEQPLGPLKPPNEAAMSHRELLSLVDSLRLELKVKDSRLRDIEDYMDSLISKVMERNPELLATQSHKSKRYLW